MSDKRTRRRHASRTRSGTSPVDYQISNPIFRKDSKQCQTSQPSCRSSSPVAEDVFWESRHTAASGMNKQVQYQIDQMNALGVYIDNSNSSSNIKSPKRIQCVPRSDIKLEQCQTPIQDGKSTNFRHHRATSPLDKTLPPLPQHHQPSEVVPLIIDTLSRPPYYSKPEIQALTPPTRISRQPVYASPLQTDFSSPLSSTPVTITPTTAPTTATSRSPITRPWIVSPQPYSSTDNLQPCHNFSSPRSPPLPPIPLNVHHHHHHQPNTAAYSKMVIKDSSPPIRCKRRHGGRHRNSGCNPLDELITRVVDLLCSCMVSTRRAKTST